LLCHKDCADGPDSVPQVPKHSKPGPSTLAWSNVHNGHIWM